MKIPLPTKIPARSQQHREGMVVDRGRSVGGGRDRDARLHSDLGRTSLVDGARLKLPLLGERAAQGRDPRDSRAAMGTLVANTVPLVQSIAIRRGQP